MRRVFAYNKPILNTNGKEMAAEKLTKKRLIQIIVMLVILLIAFFYRTYTHA